MERWEMVAALVEEHELPFFCSAERIVRFTLLGEVAMGDIAKRPGRVSAWLGWNLYCRRGRRCVDVQIGRVFVGEPGSLFCLEWRCGGCGSRYERAAIIGEELCWSHSCRRRVRG